MNKITEKDIQTIDRVNLFVGMVVILSAIFTFWNGEVKIFMFPVIFILGAFMNCMWGVKKAGINRGMAIGCFGIGVLLFLVAVFLAV